LSRRNVAQQSGGPFGAAVFDAESGRLIAAGVNRVVPQSCSVAHAEIMALMVAQQRLGQHRINQAGSRYVLATSSQPCCQCYGATVWAGIDELLIGARAEDVEELTEFDEGPLPSDWIGELERRGIAVRRDILRDQARTFSPTTAQPVRSIESPARLATADPADTGRHRAVCVGRSRSF
jgi:tRNA(Arg) A34 adenosine deaminase TadA